MQLFGGIKHDDEVSSNIRTLVRKQTSKISVVKIEEDDDNKFPNCMIHPDGRLKKFWNIILSVLLLYTAIVMPYRMAFVASKMWDTWFFVELTVDILFF